MWGDEESHLLPPRSHHCHAFPSTMDRMLQTASPSKLYSPKLLLVMFFATQEVTCSESVTWYSDHLHFSEERSWDLCLWLWRAAGSWETDQRNGEPLVVSHRWGDDMQTETKYDFGRKNKQFTATTNCSYAHALKAGTSFLMHMEVLLTNCCFPFVHSRGYILCVIEYVNMLVYTKWNSQYTVLLCHTVWSNFLKVWFN